MEQADPLVLLIGLPAIPVALVLGKMIRWEDALLNFMRRNLVKIPVIRNLMPFRYNIILYKMLTSTKIITKSICNCIKSFSFFLELKWQQMQMNRQMKMIFLHFPTPYQRQECFVELCLCQRSQTCLGSSSLIP